MPWKHNGRIIQENKAWEADNNSKHPGTWSSWSLDYKKANGLVWEDPPASPEPFDEKFYWDDGEIQTRQWQINKIDDNNYEGTAGDVVGTAKGFSYGPAFKFEYVLLVPVKGREIKITFDDWIFKQSDTVAINRAKMTKFGIKVAELTVMFFKD